MFFWKQSFSNYPCRTDKVRTVWGIPDIIHPQIDLELLIQWIKPGAKTSKNTPSFISEALDFCPKFLIYGNYIRKNEQAIGGEVSICINQIITETMSAPLHWSEKQHLIDHVFSMLLETRTRNNCQPSAQEISKVRQILDDMNKKTDRSYIETELIMISQELLSSFEAVYNSPSQKKVHAAQQYISSHYSDPNLTLREVAEAVEASPCYLSNIFKVEAGITFSNYLTQLRLLNAKEAIEKKQNKPLYQIAEESGYYDYYYFCRRFRQYFGVSPSNI